MRQWGVDLTYAEYLVRVKKQKGRCAVCRLPESVIGKSLSVDHCHKTGKVRGLLCNACNRALGFFRDNPTSLRRAIVYLRSNQKK